MNKNFDKILKIELKIRKLENSNDQ